MDSREGGPEELVSELDDGSGDGTGRRGGLWAWVEMVLHCNPYPNIWAIKLAVFLVVPLPVNGGLLASTESL